MNHKDAKDAKKGFFDRERKDNHPAKEATPFFVFLRLLQCLLPSRVNEKMCGQAKILITYYFLSTVFFAHKKTRGKREAQRL